MKGTVVSTVSTILSFKLDLLHSVVVASSFSNTSFGNTEQVTLALMDLGLCMRELKVDCESFMVGSLSNRQQ